MWCQILGALERQLPHGRRWAHVHVRRRVRLLGLRLWVHIPARPCPSSIFLDKNRRGIGKSQSIWTDSKMETAGSQRLVGGVATVARIQRGPRSHAMYAPWPQCLRHGDPLHARVQRLTAGSFWRGACRGGCHGSAASPPPQVTAARRPPRRSAASGSVPRPGCCAAKASCSTSVVRSRRSR
jgi:hypothetical protein